MKLQCDYCGNTYEDTQENCPFCGARNPSHQNSGEPKTIEELKEWYKARNLPDPEVTRFFIGVDYKKPKAFGIYKDENGDFVVYKNKGNGERAVRYKGDDEEYAVSELYQKLKDEIVHQKSNNGDFSNSRAARRAAAEERSNRTLNITAIAFFVFVFIGIAGMILDFTKGWHNGYYSYDDTVYYVYDDNWYYYDDYSNWQTVSKYDAIPQEIASNYDDYFLSKSWNSSISATDWDNTSFYDEVHSSDYDSDSDYNWDSNDSWDSGGTDWDSDW